MGGSYSVRDAALDTLTACRRNGAWADGELKRVLNDARFDGRDAALCTRLVYGVLQNRALLDFYLSCFYEKPFKQLQPQLQDILELGAYQLLFTDKIPDHAAVNEAVEQAKRRGCRRAAPLVNGLLRRLSREKAALPALPRKSEAEYLSLRYSHPLWLVEEYEKILPSEEVEQLLELQNSAPPLTIQINSLKTTSARLQRDLQQLGVDTCVHPWLDGCLELSGTGSIEQLDAFQNGEFMVQDAAARIAAVLSGVKPGDFAIDVCAAPGGKSFALAMMMQDQGEIRSCDIHPHKLRLIENGAKRLGISCIKTQLADGRVLQEEWIEKADVVFCDVPCSGLGVIRKKPDARYKDPEELARLPEIQSAILKNASRYVKSGGVLLYSTCTVLSRENRQVVDLFLKDVSGFEIEPTSLSGRTPQEDWTLWPHIHGTDGFYICKLRKK